MAIQADPLLPGEKADLIEDAKDVLGDLATEWLDTENSQLGGEKPRDLIESGDPTKRQFVRDILRAVRYGVFS